MELQVHIGRQSDFHQCHIVFQKFQFTVQRDEILIVVVKQMTQQPAEVLYCLLCLVGIEGDEGVDVIQRIEQEVRVELVAQVLQLGFRALFSARGGRRPSAPSGGSA